MDWLKFIGPCFKSTPKAPTINNYIVIFSGLFCYNTWQKSLIQKRTGYSVAKFDPNLFNTIKSQYYPVFRKFILNDCPNDYREIQSSLTYDLQIGSQKSQGEKFRVNDIKLSFFDDNLGVGVYSFAIKFSEQRSFSTFIQLLRIIRDFDTSVSMGKKSYQMREFIESNILRCEDRVDTSFKMEIDNNSDVFGYSGSKLKSFIAVEIEKLARGYSMEEALYELGTFTDYATSIRNMSSHSPSQEYFDSILSNQISVFQNWSALALFDSFVLIGKQGYLENPNTVSTIRGSYFKIFLFNLYSKFYLFKTNSDLETNKKKKITHALYSFLRNYDISYISFNFLPNLLHEKIRNAFQIHSELSSVRSKIELMESQKKESGTKWINAILYFIALLGGISVIADLPIVSEHLLGDKYAKITTILAITLIIVGIVVLSIYHKTIKKKS